MEYEPRPSLDQLRQTLTPSQRRVVNTIWGEFKQRGHENPSWFLIDNPPTAVSRRRLHRLLGRDPVESAVNALGGSVVQIHHIYGGGGEQYVLTLLGAMLTDDGPELQAMVSRYLEFVRAKYLENPDVPRVSSGDAQSAGNFSALEIMKLGGILRLADCPWPFGGSDAGHDWVGLVLDDIEDLADSSNVAEYASSALAELHDADCPIGVKKRQQYRSSLLAGNNCSATFVFINDPRLRKQLDSDWRELQLISDVPASKARVVLAGGIVEGMLLSALRQRQSDAHAARVRLKLPKRTELEKWLLADMVCVARDLGLLSSATAHLCDAVRAYRNLIHPALQAAEGVTVDRGQSVIAAEAVMQVMRELRAGNQAEDPSQRQQRT